MPPNGWSRKKLRKARQAMSSGRRWSRSDGKWKRKTAMQPTANRSRTGTRRGGKFLYLQIPIPTGTLMGNGLPRPMKN